MMSMLRPPTFHKEVKSHQKRKFGIGQSFVELALMMPILLLMLAGMVEVVLAFNDYLQILDGASRGARFISDSHPYPDQVETDLNIASPYDDIKDCDDTLNFFRVAACTTVDGLAPIVLVPGTGLRTNTAGTCANPEPAQDDIVISIFGTRVWDDDSNSTTPKIVSVTRFDNNTINSSSGTAVGELVADNSSSSDGAESGWSYMEDQHSGVGGMCSTVTTAEVQSFLLNTAPNTGIVLIEVFFNHDQVFDMPGFGDVIPNPILLHAYAFFPLVSAEPTTTPSP
jgi:hypothetical protein